MTMANTTFRMDAALEEELRRLMSDLGLDMSTYFAIPARQAVREQGIPFKVTMDVPNVEAIKAMQDTRDGIGLSRRFSPVPTLMGEFDADSQIPDRFQERLQENRKTWL